MKILRVLLRRFRYIHTPPPCEIHHNYTGSITETDITGTLDSHQDQLPVKEPILEFVAQKFKHVGSGDQAYRKRSEHCAVADYSYNRFDAHT